VRRLTTSQVGVGFTTGTSNDTSDVITGDFGQLLLGVRTALTVTVLQERYMVESGSIGLVGWYRGDVAVARAKAFDVIRGVRA
jgi:HK97 family phage major capsid protein